MGDWFTGALLVLAAALLAVAYRRTTALRRTIAAREELQSQAQALFEGSPIASWVFDRVSDSGGGIPAEIRAQVFDPGVRLALVVTDVVMPQMGGWEMAAQLRKRRPEKKILFTSGYNEEIANAHGCVDEGIEFLPKPYLPAVLTQRVRQVLDTDVS